ncbi:MAG: hypothetical protein U0228_00655 [Myxococcaceae bacterium]
MSRLVALVALVSSVALAVPRQVEERALFEQVDERLRSCNQSLVLRPSLDVLPGALRLKVVVVRSADRAVLGSITTRASGASREAQLRAVTTQACREARQLQ